MSEIVFRPWPKMARLNRECVITEKIDGTNACVIVADDGQVAAQSRNRLLTPGDDNFGFAAWVDAYKDALRDILGPGHHFGEWWGAGIQRRYGCKDKRFSLFNAPRWRDTDLSGVPCLRTVPILYEGRFETVAVEHTLALLREAGSIAEPGFMDPEGVVVYHTAANVGFKVTLEKDDEPKGAQS